MSKENQRVAITKRMLKESIMSLLEKKRIDEISVVELCALSGINRTTFYRHYQTPHDVLLEMELDFVKELYAAVPHSQCIVDIKGNTVKLCQFIFERKETVKLFTQNNTDSNLIYIFQDFTSRFLTSRKILYKGHDMDADTFRLIQTLFSYGIYALIRQWIVDDVPVSPEKIAEIIVSTFEHDFSFL